MIEDVRLLLTPRSLPVREKLQQIRGKYKFVPTSCYDFIQRKGEELELELE